MGAQQERILDHRLNLVFIACLILGAAGGLESRIAGRKLAVATHMAATALGFFAIASCAGPIEASFGIGDAPMYALCGAFIICAWIAESDSLRSGENIETRGDASNHVIAFVIGCGGAMGSTIVLAIAIAEMFGLFLRRARAGCEPVYGVEARAEDAG